MRVMASKPHPACNNNLVFMSCEWFHNEPPPFNAQETTGVTGAFRAVAISPESGNSLLGAADFVGRMLIA
jgi:hypothetical protein